MNRRNFFAAVVGGAVAPKVAVSPHPTMLFLRNKANFYKLMDRLATAPLNANQFKLPLGRGPK